MVRIAIYIYRWAILWGRDWFSNYLRVELRKGIKRKALSIIELGCGTGYHIAVLASEFKECTFYGLLMRPSIC